MASTIQKCQGFFTWLSKDEMKIQVIIIVSANAARSLQQKGEPTTGSKELLMITEELGVLLEPVHPGSDDPLLTPYFMVEVPDSTTAECVITHLRKSKAIEAAYIKPPDEFP
jgi:hypothetical protein